MDSATDEPLELARRAHYVSTYCIDDLHLQCRLRCTNCFKPCRCACHVDGRGKPITVAAELQPV